MLGKPVSLAAAATPVRVVIITLDNHLSGAVERARARFDAEQPGVTIGFHAAADFEDASKLAAARADIARGDIIISTMLFLEDHIRAVLPALQARREHCDAMVNLMSAGDIVEADPHGRLPDGRPTQGSARLVEEAARLVEIRRAE